MDRIQTQRGLARRTSPPQVPQPPTEPVAEAPAARPRLTRSRHLPPRDEHGAVCGTVEIAATTTNEQHERFRVLALTLHRRWFLERPSPLNTTTPITAAPTATAC